MEKEVTIHGLHHWFTKTFEKLGWIFLAMNEGNSEKVTCYINSVNRLLASLNDKVKKVEENDRKNDLIIMIKKVNILKGIIDNILVKTNKIQMGGKRGSRKGSKKPSRKGSKKGSKKGK